jgi:hypothetical protein
VPALKITPAVPEPTRVRRIEGSFGWLDHRLLREGHLERMCLFDIALYVFLVLAADRNGVSFYRKDVISRKLGIDWSQFETAKARLLERGLVAFKPFSPREIDGFYQVLALPTGGPR